MEHKIKHNKVMPEYKILTRDRAFFQRNVNSIKKVSQDIAIVPEESWEIEDYLLREYG